MTTEATITQAPETITQDAAPAKEIAPRYTPGPFTRARLDRDFTYHPPKPDQPGRYEAIRAAAKDLALGLCENCPDSRELSLAMTKLEEAVFWANAAIARNE